MPGLPILMYHMVSKPNSVEEVRYAIPQRRFEAHMRTLREKGYTFISLNQVESYLSDQRAFPDKTVAVTLDDGYADNFSNAFPILHRNAIPATIFLVLNDLGGMSTWMRERSHRILDWGQVREMHSEGIFFGSHTISHPRLSHLPNDRARFEIEDAKKRLEDRLGASAHHFAYPYGDLTERTVDLVREAGHTLACSTRCGFNQPNVDPLVLRRINVYGTDRTWMLLQKLRFGTNDAGLFKPVRYYWRRATNRLSAT